MNKSILLASVAILITLTACTSGRRERASFGDMASSAQHQTASIQVGSLTRTFRWYAPKSNTTGQRLPVVVLLHGGGRASSGAIIGNMTQAAGGFDAFAEQKGIIAIYPDALGGNWNDGRETIQHKNDDVSFIIAAIDYVAKVNHGDLNRVFVAGISNGGMMAQRIACDAPQKVSAIAVVASALPRALANACQTNISMPVVFLTGDADPLVPFNGGQVKAGLGGDMLSAAATVHFWATKNAATFQATRKVPDTDPNDGTTTSVDIYLAKGKVAVAFYRIAGGGHTWPGGLQYAPRILIGNVARDFSGNQAIWDFFVGR